MQEVYVRGSRVSVAPLRALGSGGEADVYDLGNGLALKIFKHPDHPDFQGFPEDQQVAALRLAQHQRKLPAFPAGLPARVVTPIDMATDRSGKQIAGYTMPLLSSAEKLRRFSEHSFYQPDRVAPIFLDLHNSVSGLHKRSVILGDFNDLNVLVNAANEAYLIDADSYEFGSFRSAVFTDMFVDPLLCDYRGGVLHMVQPYNVGADWYAYAVMLFQSLLRVDPYGGVYMPQDATRWITQKARPLQGISVFHADVRYPKHAVPFRVLPDDLLNQFFRVFANNERQVFPRRLLESLRWTKCGVCGETHARSTCPNCAHAVPSPAVTQVTAVRGTVTSIRVLSITGTIVHAAFQSGALHVLYTEGDRLLRERLGPATGKWQRANVEVVLDGPADPNMRFRIKGDQVWIGKGNRAVAVADGQVAEQLSMDAYGSLPLFDTNEAHVYWASGGNLYRDGTYGPDLIGRILTGQTLFWCSPTFGVGFQRAGGWTNAIVFDAQKRQSITDVSGLPRLSGQLVDATCTFADDRAWLFLAVQEKGKTINRCVVIRSDGSVEATAEAEQGDGSWLSHVRGKCAVANFLLVPTDDGIVRVDVDGGTLRLSRTFPDSEPFVTAGCQLFAHSGGLIVVDRREVRVLTLA